LAPRAYIITPVGANAVTLTYTFMNGNIDLEGGLPISVNGHASTPVFSYFHTFNFFSRSANITALIPYGIGTFAGRAGERKASVYRSGLLDSAYRISVNLKGGPAMSIKEYGSWRQKTLLGASLSVVAPTGQYDAMRVINYSTGRWTLKPEVGLSRRWDRWVLDAYGSVWFVTEKQQNLLTTSTITQGPIGAIESHLSHDLNGPRFWCSLDGNFWYGGIQATNGVTNPFSRQTNSRVGVTTAVPITEHQAFKFSYSRGAYIRYGGNYHSVSVAWQYSWLKRPD